MNTIFLGNYWQSNWKKKEPIEWIILKEDDEKMYVISRYCLDRVPYSDGRQIAWKNSFMRKWLNDYFLNAAFSEEEQKKIILAKIKTSNTQGLDKGTSTQDKIFLPSKWEALFYFGYRGLYDIVLNQKRIARPTQYAWSKDCWLGRLEYGSLKDSLLKDCLSRDSKLTNGAINPDIFLWQDNCKKCDQLGTDTSKQRFATCWYLRSSGNQSMYIYTDGSYRLNIKDEAVGINNYVAVRPAMWVKK